MISVLVTLFTASAVISGLAAVAAPVALVIWIVASILGDEVACLPGIAAVGIAGLAFLVLSVIALAVVLAKVGIDVPS